ncbi:hypothetical protein, partial [Enterobacter hormaechei]|uniref:hypothetical protein n=1 Tax=Enterobacter hormaechei TaxID=158836 RepID=UPI002040524C
PSRWGALQQIQDIHLAAGVPMENVTVVVPRNGEMGTDRKEWIEIVRFSNHDPPHENRNRTPKTL